MSETEQSILTIQDQARRLYDAHGDKAEFEAAQKARVLEEQGDTDQAETWRKVREAIRLLRGPHES